MAGGRSASSISKGPLVQRPVVWARARRCEYQGARGKIEPQRPALRLGEKCSATPTIFEKLNLKHQRQIVVLGAPESFEPELGRLRGVKVIRDIGSGDSFAFSLAFVTKQDQVDTVAPEIANKAEVDAVIWFAYPKGTSKKYKSEISRDRGWDILRKLGFDTVRAVAIDEDWSALRFRRVEFVNSLTRDSSHALSPAGRARTKRKK